MPVYNYEIAIFIYIYTYISINVCIYIYIYIYISINNHVLGKEKLLKKKVLPGNYQCIRNPTP